MTLTRRAAFIRCISLAIPVAPAAARTSPTLMLGQDAPQDPDPRGYLVSEKFDGVRALWDGHALRFRSGDPVAAPGWFTAGLPAAPLDGELWLGRARFEPLLSVVRKARPEEAGWRAVRYLAFDQPATHGPFAERAARLAGLVQRTACPWLQAVAQDRLDHRAEVQQRLRDVLALGGEGLMLHRADALWRAGRTDVLLKLKPRHDAEARAVGHVPGQGRHAGRLGALRVRRDDGAEFLLGTGLSDAQRDQPPHVGAVVTYRHQGFTEAGLPRFASFLRVRTD